MSLETELKRARELDVDELAGAIEEIGFECTHCGACCTGGDDEHTATIFPGEVRRIDGEWAEIARPMPYGLETGTGETFEWALQTDACGDCAFHESGDGDDGGRCGIYGDRPLVCQTYPFSVALDETNKDGDGATAGGGVVETVGSVEAHECEGLGREIDREDAHELAETLKERTIKELEEAIAVRDGYEPTAANGVVVHDSEGQKRPDGTRL